MPTSMDRDPVNERHRALRLVALFSASNPSSTYALSNALTNALTGCAELMEGPDRSEAMRRWTERSL